MPSEIISNLNNAITMEIEAIQVYTEYRNIIARLGDTKTVEVFEHIIKEEWQHQAEFEARLNELNKEKDVFGAIAFGPGPSTISDIFSSQH